MPWAVGRYGDQDSFNNLYTNVALPDIQYTQANKIEYLFKNDCFNRFKINVIIIIIFF